MTYILADIGGTKMRVARSDDKKTVSEHVTIQTPQDFDEAMEALCDLAKQVAGEEAIEAFASGVPGPVDEDSGILVHATHLPEWEGKSLKDSVKKYLDIQHIYFTNDADLVGLGEAITGAGKGYSIVAYITVSTGVGGARISHGEIDKDAQGNEIGHHIIEAEEVEVGGDNPIPGTVEYYISGTSLERRTGEKPWDTVDPGQFGKEWEKMERYLAYTLHNISVFWTPDVIVIGGSMMTKKTLFTVESLKERLSQTLTMIDHIPEIKKAIHKDRGGLEGALAYINSQLG